MELIALLGGMGVGKTTICNHLLSLGEQPEMRDSGISFCHLSSGRLLRQAVARKSHKEWLGIQVAMDDGQPVPDQIVIEVIFAEITRFRFQAHGSVTKTVCLLDNFPANKLQTDLLRERIGPLRGAFLCECSEETMLSRVEARAEDAERQEGPKSTPERRDNNAEMEAEMLAKALKQADEKLASAKADAEAARLTCEWRSATAGVVYR